MTVITISLQSNEETVSESAKAPSYTAAKVAGKTELVLPSSKRAAITEIKSHLKTAVASRKKALSFAAKHENALGAALGASTTERRKALKQKAAGFKKEVTASNKAAKAALTAANKSARTHGLSGLTLPLNATNLADSKKLAKVDITTFGMTGKRGAFKPKFTPDHKFSALIGQSIHKMPGNAAAIKRTKARVAVEEKEEAANPKSAKQKAAERTRVTGRRANRGGAAAARGAAARAKSAKRTGVKNAEGKENLRQIYLKNRSMSAVIDKLEGYHKDVVDKSAHVYGDEDGSVHYDNGKMKLKITSAGAGKFILNDHQGKNHSMSKKELTHYLSEYAGSAARDKKMADRAEAKAAGTVTKKTRLPARKLRPLTHYND